MTALINNIEDLPTGPVNKLRWTAIIPAAGRGSRLGSDQPKILYPILGRPILVWLLEALEPVCSRVVLVLSPDGSKSVQSALPSFNDLKINIAIQNQPTGMADAVRLAAPLTETDFALVVWGDQVTLRSRTLIACAALHERRLKATLTLPTVLKHNPYIDMERDPKGRIYRVLQAREGEISRNVGENDCGLFLFTANVLFDILASSAMVNRGRRTGESNLLQLLPAFEQGTGSVATVRLDDPNETLGVNTPQDAEIAASIISKRLIEGLRF
jgi:bifunctional UDP-N-acetylglucosamine pyrophosphorylase/glucosamine-1-phosphate N-acetyltransferase